MVKVCRKAAKILIRDFGEIENLQVSLKGPGNFVTASDRKVEKIIIEELQKARPTYSILSEEIGEINNDESFKWIIDPIDGTSNFLHGIPHFAISIGLEHNKEIICGIIFNLEPAYLIPDVFGVFIFIILSQIRKIHYPKGYKKNLKKV